MGGNYDFFEIVLFACIAAFLVYRLRSVLGRRTGQEQSRGDNVERHEEENNDNVIALSNLEEGKHGAEGPKSAEAGIAQIRISDPSFDEERFTEGARAAFEMIINAFSSGDGKTLRTLLSDEVYGNFAKEIRAREIANHTHETTLVSINASDIIEAYMEGPGALITIRFVSDQVNTTRDTAGEMVEGEAEVVAEVTDIWTFARDVRSKDPNWTLVATRSPD